MTKSEAQKIIDEAIKLTDPYDIDCHEFAMGWKKGTQFMLQLLRDRPELLVVFDEVEALVDRMKNTSSWLRRMKNLEWFDPEYAPRFKACLNHHDEAIKPFTKESL